MTELRYCVPDDREALTALWQQAFGDPKAFIDLFFDTAFSPDRSRVYVADGTIAGMLFWFDCTLKGAPCAYLYAVATDKAFRGRGISTALLADTHALLAGRGYAGVILSPGSQSLYRFYQMRGYRTAGFTAWETVSAGDPVEIREVDNNTFAALRRKLLPPEGVIQERENIAYLHRLARFWTGNGWVAAVSRQGDAILEFLGRPESIPGLLGALGIPHAQVRYPGRTTPLAMIHPLAPEWKPGNFYFGLPFD